MQMFPEGSGSGSEPTPGELAAIEREWPALEAELALVDAEIHVLTRHGGASPLDWRRLRRAEHQALTARHLIYGTQAPADLAGFHGPEVA